MGAGFKTGDLVEEMLGGLRLPWNASKEDPSPRVIPRCLGVAMLGGGVSDWLSSSSEDVPVLSDFFFFFEYMFVLGLLINSGLIEVSIWWRERMPCEVVFRVRFERNPTHVRSSENS